MRVDDISEVDEVTHIAEVTIRDVDAVPGTAPAATFTLDLGKRAADALTWKDWAGLGRLQPAAKRSKDPARVQGAVNRRTTAPAAAPVPPTTPAAPPAD